MNIKHHPDDSTLMAYSAGSLVESFNLVVAAHAEHCLDCRSKMADGEFFGGQMLMALAEEKTSSDSFERLWKRIESEPGLEKSSANPDPNLGKSSVLSRYIDGNLETVQWKKLIPGVRHYPLTEIFSGTGSARLLSIDPGVEIPEHTHRSSELTLILQGAYEDENGLFSEGDIADLDNSVHHRPIVTGEENCICLIATDAPLEFSGILSRLVQTFIRI